MAKKRDERVKLATRASAPGERWAPVVGPETTALFDRLRLPKESEQTVASEACSVLARSVPPAIAVGTDTGLVVGYVQSGKTMSFTTISALARDNQYNLVIIIAGTSTYLLGQSTKRLLKDLRIEESRRWRHFESSSWRDTDKTAIQDTLASWADPSVPPEERRTVLITAMKHHKHLDKVAQSLPKDLRHVRALIIDDEADQASLNAAAFKRTGEESTTYTRITALRSLMPHHTFLQYTATPQAPLLINIIDTLSPKFVEVLTPGADYVGGKELFIDNQHLVIDIPPEDDPSAVDELVEPPPSLLRAMRLFFVGVAVGQIEQSERVRYRSMMVHPSQQVIGHEEFLKWVKATRDSWKRILDPAEQMPEDRDELLKDFRTAYNELNATASELPQWKEIEKRLHHAVRDTRIEKVNATPGAADEIKWHNSYSWILVGGQAMDRGFTVEGLTVTYMPRGLGVGNADTIQQRGRFFGYKRSYLGLCRIFLGAGVKAAFTRYVRHEEDVRARLKQHRDTGQSLAEWKRAFLLDRALRPTRASVLDLDYLRMGGARESWFVSHRPHADREASKANFAVIDELRQKAPKPFVETTKDRTKHQTHTVSIMPLRMALQDCLAQLRFADPEDSQRFTLLTILLTEALEKDPKADCAVYWMSEWRVRERGLDPKNDSIKALFSGASPVDLPNRGKIYPGDKEVTELRNMYAVQFHRLNLTTGKSKNQKVLHKDIATVAFYAPSGLGADYIVQGQPTQEAP